MSQENKPRTISFTSAMAYLNAPETYATGTVIVKHRTPDVFELKGTEIYSAIDSIEKCEHDDETMWLTINDGFATISHYEVIEYLLFEPNEKQVEARIRICRTSRKNAWVPTAFDISEIILEQKKMNELIGIKAA